MNFKNEYALGFMIVDALKKKHNNDICLYLDEKFSPKWIGAKGDGLSAIGNAFLAGNKFNDDGYLFSTCKPDDFDRGLLRLMGRNCYLCWRSEGAENIRIYGRGRPQAGETVNPEGLTSHHDIQAVDLEFHAIETLENLQKAVDQKTQKAATPPLEKKTLYWYSKALNKISSFKIHRSTDRSIKGRHGGVLEGVHLWFAGRAGEIERNRFFCLLCDEIAKQHKIAIQHKFNHPKKVTSDVACLLVNKANEVKAWGIKNAPPLKHYHAETNLIIHCIAGDIEWNNDSMTLFTSLEPCEMCSSLMRALGGGEVKLQVCYLRKDESIEGSGMSRARKCHGYSFLSHEVGWAKERFLKFDGLFLGKRNLSHFNERDDVFTYMSPDRKGMQARNHAAISGKTEGQLGLSKDSEILAGLGAGPSGLDDNANWMNHVHESFFKNLENTTSEQCSNLKTDLKSELQQLSIVVSLEGRVTELLGASDTEDRYNIIKRASGYISQALSLIKYLVRDCSPAKPV